MKPESPCAESLSKAQQQLELILKHTGEGVYGLDLSGKTTFVNNAAAKMVGLTLEQMAGKSNHSLVHHHRIDGSDYPKHDCPIYATLQDGKPRHGDDEYFWRADGSYFPIEYFSNPILDEGKLVGAVVTFIDITERKIAAQKLLDYQTKLEQMVEDKTKALAAANSELMKIAFLDGLTNVSNRRAFDEALNKEIRRAARKNQPLTLILGDVDFFKKFNDRYGHPAGDECLKRIAQTMAALFKRSGDVVARYGGEEFAVILPETNLQNSKLQAQRLLEEIQNLNIPHQASECSDRVTMSLGLIHRVPDPEDTQHFIELADEALYRAKQHGRNNFQVL